MSENQTTVLPSRPLDGDVPFVCRALLAGSVRFPVDQLLSKDGARTRVLSPNCTHVSVSDAMGCDMLDNELTPYPENDNSDDWDFANVPVDPHIDICASLRRHYDGVQELGRSTNAALSENADSVFSLRL